MSLNELAEEIYATAKRNGFWESDRNFGEMIALAHSELSEALEEHRDGKPNEYYVVRGYQTENVTHASIISLMLDNKNPKPEGVAVELADALIRILDTMRSLDVDIDAVVARKMAYNAQRPYKHGKAY